MGAEFTGLIAGLDLVYRTLADQGVGPHEREASELLTEVLPRDLDVTEGISLRESEEPTSGE